MGFCYVEFHVNFHEKVVEKAGTLTEVDHS